MKITLHLFLFVSFVAGAWGSEALIAEDSFVSSVLKGKNYGASALLTVGPHEKAFLRFDLSALPAGLTQAQIAKATLQLWVSSATFGGSVGVYEVTSEWSEKTVTGLNEPDVAMAPSGALTIPVKGSKAYVSADLTALVQSWVAGGEANNGIALVEAEGGKTLSFDSKENMATSHEPRLEIVLAGPQGQQGLAGVNGMDGMKGDKGDKGDQGPPGSQGTPGLPATAVQGGLVSVASSSNPTPPAGYSDTGIRSAGWSVRVANGILPYDPLKAVVAGQRLFALEEGGIQLSEYDLTSDTWTGSFIPIPSASQSAVTGTPDGFIYAIGGLDTTGHAVATARRFSLSTGTWTPIPDAPRPVADGPIVILNGVVYLFYGGFIEKFDTNANRWTEETIASEIVPFLPIAIGNTIYGSGGGALVTYTPSLDSFTTGPFPALNYAAGIVQVDTGAIMLYTNSGETGSAFRFDVASGVWSPESSPPVQIDGRSLVAYVGNEVVFISGEGYNQVVRAKSASFTRIFTKD